MNPEIEILLNNERRAAEERLAEFDARLENRPFHYKPIQQVEVKPKDRSIFWRMWNRKLKASERRFFKNLIAFSFLIDWVIVIPIMAKTLNFLIVLFFYDIFGVFNKITERGADNLLGFTVAVSVLGYIMLALLATITIIESGDYEWY